MSNPRKHPRTESPEPSMTPATPQSPIMTTQDPVWEEGDLTLLSADNVVFRVDTHVVTGMSIVLRDMIACAPQAGEKRTIPFTDLSIETADTIRLFLSVLDEGLIDSMYLQNPIGLILPAIDFLHKYDCPLARRLLSYKLLDAFNGDALDKNTVFMLAANLNELPLAKHVIRLQFKSPISPYARLTANMAIPFELFKFVPHTYLYALERTHSLQKAGEKGNDAANRFETALKKLSNGQEHMEETDTVLDHFDSLATDQDPVLLSFE